MKISFDFMWNIGSVPDDDGHYWCYIDFNSRTRIFTGAVVIWVKGDYVFLPNGSVADKKLFFTERDVSWSGPIYPPCYP